MTQTETPARILVVDDEDNYLSLLSKVLRKEGYEVSTARGGEEALQIVRERRCDVALLDIKMFPMDGLEVLEKIKAESPSTKAIIFTAYPSPENRKLSYEKGAVIYLVKPVDLRELKERIARILSGEGCWGL